MLSLSQSSPALILLTNLIDQALRVGKTDGSAAEDHTRFSNSGAGANCLHTPFPGYHRKRN
jgi:hypothetical protein